MFPDGTAFVSLKPGDREVEGSSSSGAMRHSVLKSSEESSRRTSSAGAGRMAGSDRRGEKPRTPYLDLRGVEYSHDEGESEKERDSDKGRDHGNVVAALSPRVAARMVPQGTDKLWGAGKGSSLLEDARSNRGQKPSLCDQVDTQKALSGMQERDGDRGRDREGGVGRHNYGPVTDVSPALFRSNSNSSSHANPYEDDFEILEVDDDSEVRDVDFEDSEFDIDAVLRKNR